MPRIRRSDRAASPSETQSDWPRWRQSVPSGPELPHAVPAVVAFPLRLQNAHSLARSHCPLHAPAFLAVILLSAFTAKADVVAARAEFTSVSGASLLTDVDEEQLEASK